MQKRTLFRSNKVRNSARGEDCTIKSPWCLNGRDCNETVVLAHYNMPGHGKMGGKSDDFSAAYACAQCHDWLDGRFIPPRGHHPWLNKEEYWFKGVLRTLERMFDSGVLVEGGKK